MPCPGGSDSLTAAEVAEWFPDSAHGRPTPEACIDLTTEINAAASLEVLVKKEPPRADLWIKHYAEAAKLARRLQQELNAVVKLGGRGGGITAPREQVWSLLAAVDGFLSVAPGRRVGAPTASWPRMAAMWSQRVAKVVAKPGKRPPSLHSDSGPVTAVVSQILRHCYGIDIDQAQIGRRLRELGARRKSRGESA
jgi:hypothetical protein